MARLEIDIAANSSGLVKATNQASTALTSLEKNFQNTQKEIQRNVNVSRGLEGALKALKGQLDSGAISEDQYAKKAQSIGNALDKSRGAIAQNQSRLTSLNATMKQVRSGTDVYGQSVKKLNSYHSSFNSGIRSSNTVALEFGRIIQDAPYGIQGVANNIQQLTTNFGYYAQSAREAAAQSGKTLSTFGLIKGAAGSLLSPMNLLTLGVSLATAGWVAYQKWGGKAKKTTDDVKQSFEEYLKTLNEIQAVNAKGESNSQKQLTDLRLLYDATQNSTLSLEDRQKAVDSLQKQFPSYFGNLKDETIIAGQAKGAYDRLANSILATSQARAAADKIIEGAKVQLENRLRNEEDIELLNAAELRIKAARAEQAVYDAVGQSATGLAKVNAALRERNEIGDRINDRSTKSGIITDQNRRLQQEVTDKIKEGADVTLQFSDNVYKANKNLKETKSITDKITLSPFEQSIKNSLDDLQKVRGQLNEIFNKGSFDPFDLSGITSPKGGVSTPSGGVSAVDQSIVNQISKDSKNWFKEPKKEADELGRTMSRAIDRAGRDFFDTITGFNQLTDKSFQSIFSNLTTGLTSALNEVFLGTFSTMLEDIIKKSSSEIKIGGLSNKISQAIVAGAGLAGGIISGATNRTSSVGQGLGGAVSGAAAGLAFGPVGAVIGGLVGAIGGIFGAGKARKEERELQRKQLEEARKQTELLRKSALAYTSSIIGQMTNQGIVTGVDRNAFGDITFRVEGRDLVATLNREQKAQDRGLL